MFPESGAEGTPPDSSHAPARRAVCGNCLRPRRACICGCVFRAGHAAQVLILQHPLEVHQAKGSARLLHLCLPHSRLETGSAFDAGRLDALLHGPWTEDRAGAAACARQPVLLYPSGPGDAGAPFDASLAPHRLRLVILDGTWRKSRRMLHENPQLAALPRLSLDETASRYRIRKARRAGQLSTFEAASHALAQLEGNAFPLDRMLAAFDAFVASQQAFLPDRDAAP